MIWKKLGKSLLYPHIALMILLVPIAAVMVSYSMVLAGTESAITIISYVLAAYALTVWCFRIPHLVRSFKKFKSENRIASKWFGDRHLRINMSLYCSLLWNTAYALLQLGIGFYHGSLWFCSLAAYYLSLAVMRFFLVRHTARYKLGERMNDELVKYRICGWVFLVMNLVLTLMVFFMVYWNRTFHHSEITAIAMAAYTFGTFTVSLISMVKYKKFHSPVYSAAKIINFTAACVSMLTLESTMLNTFGSDADESFRRLMLALTGGAVALLILFLAVYMITASNKQLKKLRSSENNGTA